MSKQLSIISIGGLVTVDHFVGLSFHNAFINEIECGKGPKFSGGQGIRPYTRLRGISPS